MAKITQKIISLLTAVSIIGAMAVTPVMAEAEENQDNETIVLFGEGDEGEEPNPEESDEPGEPTEAPNPEETDELEEPTEEPTPTPMAELTPEPTGPRMSFDVDFDDESVTPNIGAATEGTNKGAYAESYDGTKAYQFNSSYLKPTKEDGTPLLTGLEEFTVSYWADMGTRTGWSFFAAPNADKVAGLRNETYIGILDNNTGITVERYNNSGSRPGNANTSGLESGWKHIIMVQTPEESILYVDGELVSSVKSNYSVSSILGDESIIQIGKANWNSGEYATGLIDNYHIYNYALSADEINKLHKNEAPDEPDKPSPEMIFDINFDDGNVTPNIGAATEATNKGTYAESYNGTKAYQFNQSYLKPTKEDGTSLFTGLNEFTVSYWADMGTKTGWSFFAAPNTDTQVNNDRTYIGILDNNTKITVERYKNSKANAEIIDKDELKEGWKHIVIVEKSGQSELYVDGKLASSGPSTCGVSSILGNESIIQIGKGNWGKGEYAAGLIDNYHIYNYALSADEISNLYLDEMVPPETTGTLALDEVFAFKTADTKPTVYRLLDRNWVYTDKGVTISASNYKNPDEYLTEISVGTVTGTVFESLGDDTKVYKFSNTDDGGNARWDGYVTVKATISKPGAYRISMLGSSSGTRGFKAIYGNNKETPSTTSAGLGICTADVEIANEDITDGTVEFKITGNTDCPEIYALHIAKIEKKITLTGIKTGIAAGSGENAEFTIGADGFDSDDYSTFKVYIDGELLGADKYTIEKKENDIILTINNSALDGKKADDEVTVKVTHDAYTDGTGTITMTAQVFTITFNNDDGSLLKEIKTEAGKAPSYSGTPTKADDEKYTYKFSGWEPALAAATADATYTAKYTATPKKYKVTLNTNEGILADEDDIAEYTYGTSVTLPVPTMENYDFAGWYDNKELTGDAVVEIPDTATGNKTYWVKWTPKIYTVTLNLNGGELENADNYTSYIYGTGLTLPKNPTKADKFFGGWYNNEGCTGTAVSVISKTAAGDRVYWAKWLDEAPSAYIITFMNGEEVLWSDEVAAGVTPSYSGIPTKAQDDKYTYTFSGWEPEIAPVTGPETYEAHFDRTPRTYTVTLDADGGTIADSITSYTYGTGADLPTEVTKAGYDFDGWYDLNDKKVTAISSGATGDKTYKAKWTAQSYNVSLELNGGILADEDNIAEYTYGTAVTLPVPTRDKYTFAGWYDNEAFTGDALTEISAADTGDKTYYAKWTKDAPTTYTITFKNGDELLLSIEAALGETPSYNGAAPTKAQDDRYTYTFSGWSPEITAVTEAATYEAQFTQTPRTYTVTLDADGGKIEGNVTSYTYGTAVTLPSDVTKEGYTFDGWYDETDTAVTSIGADATGDKTYHAKWIKNAEPEYIEALGGFKNMLTVEKVTDENGEKLIVSPINGSVLSDLILYSAVYKADGSLESVKMTKCSVGADGNIIVPLSQPQIKNGESYKLMLWTNDMKPLTESIH